MFRNLQLFGFLTGLLLLFFVFYIYQAQNVELYNIRNQIEFERSRHIKMKSENIDFKAKLEKYRSSEASLKKELQSLRLSQKESNEKLAKRDNILLSYTENLKQLQDDKNMCFTAMASVKAELVCHNSSNNHQGIWLPIPLVMALAKLTITTMRANFTSMGSVIKTPEKIVESLKTRLQGENAHENIRQETNLTISPLAITKSTNESKSRKDISTQDKKMLFQQGAILLEPVVPEHIIVSITKPSSLHSDTIASVPQAQLNFENVLDVNGQFSFVQKKNQMKRNTGNDNDNDGKQEIASDYGDNALEEHY